MILTGCIAKSDERLFPSAEELQNAMEQVIGIIDRGGQAVNKNVTRTCMVCGYGKYKLVADQKENVSSVQNLGVGAVGGTSWRIYRCLHCGHIQLFEVQKNPPAWGEV